MRKVVVRSSRKESDVSGEAPKAEVQEPARRRGRPRSAERALAKLSPPPRLVRRTLQDNVYEYLREALRRGDFAPGDHLTVRGVAHTIGTSVMPVREAFRRLTSEGALDSLSTGATRVPIFDLPKLEALVEIRLTVEALAARRAAERITEQELHVLEEHDEQIKKALARGDRRGALKANEAFHFCIYHAARSAELLRIIEHLWLQEGPYLAWLLNQPDEQQSRPRAARAFRGHKDIVDALRRGDPAQAESAIRADLMTSATFLMASTGNLPKSRA